MRELLNLFALVFGLTLGAVVVLLWAAPVNAATYTAPVVWMSSNVSTSSVWTTCSYGTDPQSVAQCAYDVLKPNTTYQMVLADEVTSSFTTYNFPDAKYGRLASRLVKEGTPSPTNIGTIYKAGRCDSSASVSVVGGAVICTVSACPVGMVEQDGICKSACPDNGTPFSSGMYDVGTDPASMPQRLGCEGACETVYSGSGVVGRQMIGGVYHYFTQGSYDYTGQSCSGGEASTPGVDTVPPPSCDPVTQDSGEVNGKTVCVDKYIPPDTVEESPVVENPDGSTTKTTTTTDGKTGDQKTSTTTTQPDGTKTTTTTTTPAPSGPSGDFCKLNPADPSCRDPKDGRWDGKGTGKGFGEEGDVVEAKAAVGLKIAEIRDSIAAKFGSAGAMSGEIPCDSVQVLGQSFSVCLSAHQSTFDMIGSALLAVALIIAFLMVLM